LEVVLDSILAQSLGALQTGCSKGSLQVGGQADSAKGLPSSQLPSEVVGRERSIAAKGKPQTLAKNEDKILLSFPKLLCLE